MELNVLQVQILQEQRRWNYNTQFIFSEEFSKLSTGFVFEVSFESLWSKEDPFYYRVQNKNLKTVPCFSSGEATLIH